MVTQMPLPDTVIDLYRMVYDYKCGAVVMLNSEKVSWIHESCHTKNRSEENGAIDGQGSCQKYASTFSCCESDISRSVLRDAYAVHKEF